MTPDELAQWRTSIAFSKRQAAEALGLSRMTFRAYETGKQPIPRYIELAVRSLSNHSASETFCGTKKDSHADL
jgi:DNA-binding XRE family transcriptional regulator